MDVQRMAAPRSALRRRVACAGRFPGGRSLPHAPLCGGANKAVRRIDAGRSPIRPAAL